MAEKMNVDEIGKKILGSLTEAGFEDKAVYIDRKIHPGGSTLELGGQEISIKTDTAVVFVDDEPGVNWGHACRYILVDTATGSRKTVKARYPPSMTDIPGTYSLLWKPKGVEDWALWYPG